MRLGRKMLAFSLFGIGSLLLKSSQSLFAALSVLETANPAYDRGACRGDCRPVSYRGVCRLGAVSAILARCVIRSRNCQLGFLSWCLTCQLSICFCSWCQPWELSIDYCSWCVSWIPPAGFGSRCLRPWRCQRKSCSRRVVAETKYRDGCNQMVAPAVGK